MEHPVVTVKQGALKGAKIKGVDGVDYFTFLGIPYAAPPINELRFQDPQPMKPWQGIREALTESEQAVQFDFFTNKIIGGEDCLYLNVSTTSLKGSRPVMFWIHGGGFNFGSSRRDFYAPDYLIKHDIVFVSFNYRLGVFGFLNMGIPTCSGNQALKDQIAALKWVHENIAAFGGDPKNVTLFGESAGSASVHALCLSPLTKGMYHKAIMQSGTMYNPWSYKHQNKPAGFKMAQKVQPKAQDARSAVEALKKISAYELSQLQQEYYPADLHDQLFAFGPTFDEASTQRVFPTKLNEMLQTPLDIPIMLGNNSHEGIFFSEHDKERINRLNNRFNIRVKTDLFATDEAKIAKITPLIRNFYFGDRPISDKESFALVQYKGDVVIVNGVQHLCDIRMKCKLPTYLYRYSFIAQLTLTQVLPHIPVPGSSHADDLTTLFYAETYGDMAIKKNTKEELVKNYMTKMWTNFAKYGDPTPKSEDLIPVKWQPICATAKNYLEINDELTVGLSPGKRSWDFWKQLDILKENYNYFGN